MSFIQSEENLGYNPGYFLAHAECDRETLEIEADHAQAVTKADGSKYVPAGAVIPANDGTAVGILYEDVDVSTGNMPGSVVVAGTIYGNRLPAALASAAATALKNIVVIPAEPEIVRPMSGASLPIPDYGAAS